MTDNMLPAGFQVGCGDSGTGRPLVLLHCSGADRHIWTRTMEAWAGLPDMPARRILRPELFGCGTTARWPGQTPFRLDDVVDLICRAIGDLDQPFDLIGHSFGGAVALHLARRMPERLRSLTLIEPTYFSLLRDHGAAEAKLFDDVVDVARQIRDGARSPSEDGRRQGFGVFVDYWNGAGKWRSVSELVQKQMASLIDVITQDFNALFEEANRLRDFRGLQVRTLIVNGTLSPEPAQRIAALLEATLPDAERSVLSGAGHMIPLTHAKELAGLVATHQYRGEPAISISGRRHAAGVLLT